MRTKFVIGFLVVTGALLAGLFWHSQRQPSSPPQAVVNPSLNGEVKPQPGSGERPAIAQTGEKPIKPIKPEALESLETALAAGLSLNPSHIGTLAKLLREIHPLDDGQAGHVRKNELMNALNRQVPLPPETVNVYAAIYRDPMQNEVIRDYAIQHVYEAYARLGDAQSKGAALTLLQEAASQSDSSIAGTAILALARLAQTDATVPNAEIAATAFALARNPAANTSARISALQVIGQFDAAQAVPVLVAAVNQGGSIPLQLSALGALGQVGGKEQVPLLRAIAQGDNARLKPAASGALRRMEQRLGAL
jgi:hypothetical protein